MNKYRARLEILKCRADDLKKNVPSFMIHHPDVKKSTDLMDEMFGMLDYTIKIIEGGKDGDKK